MLRFGLLGAGHWAAQTAAVALVHHPVASFTGVWGRDRAKTASLADRLGVTAFATPDALFTAVDAVALALPPDVQVEFAARAAAAGKHLLLDKPLALSVGAAEQLVAAIERHRVAALVFFTHRFDPQIRVRLDQLSRTGPWTDARFTWLASIFGPGSRYAGSGWRRAKGGLWDLGPHTLALALPVLGPVRYATGLTGADGTSHVLLRHQTGAVSTHLLGLDACPAAATKEFAFFGQAGVAVLPEPADGPVRAYRTAVAELVEAVVTGRLTHPCDARFGRDIVSILAAVERAAAAPPELDPLAESG